MRVSNMFFQTLREVPAEAEIASHQLMLRAGLMRKLHREFIPSYLWVTGFLERLSRL